MKNLIIGILIGLILGLAISSLNKFQPLEKRIVELEEQKEEIKHSLLASGKYRCCIKDPCDYCLEEGGCDCLDKIYSGKLPCGECIGEIIEGEANPYLSKEELLKAFSSELGEEGERLIKKVYSN